MGAGHPLAERIEPFETLAQTFLDSTRLLDSSLAGRGERGDFPVVVHDVDDARSRTPAQPGRTWAI